MENLEVEQSNIFEKKFYLDDENKVSERKLKLLSRKTYEIFIISMFLENSQKIKKMLKSDHLKNLIKKVDDTKSALKFKVLNQIIKDDEEINEFIQAMLLEMGYLDSEGRFKNDE